jgi:hypothetical protein
MQRPENEVERLRALDEIRILDTFAAGVLARGRAIRCKAASMAEFSCLV